MRLANGGSGVCKQITEEGEFPLALVLPAEGKNNSLAAKECTAANDRRANPRRAYAEMLASNEEAGPFLARG